MVRSCLVEPLIKPLIAPRPGLGRRSALSSSGLSSSRLVATALALAALASVTTYAHATHAALESEGLRSKLASSAGVVANAHRLPAKVAPKVLLERFLSDMAADLDVVAARREDDLVQAPSLSPDFDQDALSPDGLRSSPIPDPGPRLARAVQTARLRGGTDATYLLFGSAQHRAGIPTS